MFLRCTIRQQILIEASTVIRSLRSTGSPLHEKYISSLAANAIKFDSVKSITGLFNSQPAAPTYAAAPAVSKKNKREFHTSTRCEGYKSGPGTPTWKYVNYREKIVPKPSKPNRVPRFFVPTETVKSACEGTVFQLSEAETKHALRVLRLSEGAWLEVCDGKGLLVEAQLRGLTYSNKAFATASGNPYKVHWEGPRWEVVVAMGSLAGARADQLVEKITEIGAYAVRPLLTHRSRTIGRSEQKDHIKVVEIEEQSDFSELEEEMDFTATGRTSRWQRVAIAASKQCLRANGLILRPPCLLESLLPLIEAGAPALVAAQGGEPLHQALAALGSALQAASVEPQPKPCLLLVGPEGDFTEEELKRLVDAGARKVGLGPNRLRVETACMAITAGAVLHHQATAASGPTVEETLHQEMHA